MTQKDRLVSILKGVATDRPPFVISAGLIASPLFGPSGGRRLDALTVAESACRVRWLTGAENLSLPHTMRVLTEALGGEKDAPEGPLERYPLEDVTQWQRIKGKDPFENRGVRLTVESLRVLSKSYPDVPVVGDVPSAVSLAVGLVSADKVLLAAVRNKDALQALLNLLTDIIEEYAHRLIDAGADVVFIKDEFSALFGGPIFSTIALPSLNRLVESVQKRVPAVVHLCGELSSLLSALKEAPMRGLSVDATASIEQIKRELPEVAVMGNIDVQRGSYEDMVLQIRELSSAKPHIVAPACGLGAESLERLSLIKSILFSS